MIIRIFHAQVFLPSSLSSARPDGLEWMQQWVMAPFNGTEDDAIIAASATDKKRAGGSSASFVLSPENENCKDEIAGN